MNSKNSRNNNGQNKYENLSIISDLYRTKAAANTTTATDPAATLLNIAALGGEVVGDPVGVDGINDGEDPGESPGEREVGGAGGEANGASVGAELGVIVGEGGDETGEATGDTVGRRRTGG
ncbi:hypothetical protein Hanom_Chr16g01437471 [Helianthus anomalus]